MSVCVTLNWFRMRQTGVCGKSRQRCASDLSLFEMIIICNDILFQLYSKRVINHQG